MGLFVESLFYVWVMSQRIDSWFQLLSDCFMCELRVIGRLGELYQFAGQTVMHTEGQKSIKGWRISLCSVLYAVYYLLDNLPDITPSKDRT